jgi:hypothetical protein
MAAKGIKPFISILFLLITILYSCKNGYDYPEKVEQALQKAKGNRATLEKLIEHYRANAADSLKLKAAYFLIANMEGHYYVKAKLVDTSGKRVNFDVLSYPDYKTMVAAWDSTEKKRGKLDYIRDTVIYDLQSIGYDFLKTNIDLAFEAWEKPWSDFLTFDQFCEYVLPYRGSNEPLEEWRQYFFEKYGWVSDSITDKSDPVEAAVLINNEIKRWYSFDPIFYRHPTDLGLDEMLEYKRGRCEDMTNLAIYAMRSQGIAVMSDYTPAWPNTGNNHAWNALIDRNGKVVIFMGDGANPGEYRLNNKKAKVYRKTFAVQNNCLAMIKPYWEKVPRWLSGKNYIDVTKEYIPVFQVKVDFTYPQPDSINYAYLAVFNSGEWKAIHWGKIENNSALFSDMGGDIVYLPAYYKNGKLIPAGEPFILDNNGKQIPLKPDTTKLINVKLYSTTKKVTRKATDEIRITSFKKGTPYTLYYWDKEWKKLGTAKAKKDMPLRFSVPGNALLWLVKKDSNKEERIFTVMPGGAQKWW